MNQNQRKDDYRPEGFEEELSLADYWRIIKSHQSVILRVFFASLLGTTLVSNMMTPRYRATVTLFVDQESSNVLTISENNVALAGQDYATYKEYFLSQKEIIRSRTILEQVFNEFNLAQTPDYASPSQETGNRAGVSVVGDSIGKLAGKKSKTKFWASEKHAEQRDPVEKFIETVSVSDVRNTRLLKLEVEHSDPEMAAKIANRIAQIYVERNLAYISKNEILTLYKNEYLRLEAKLNELSKVYKDKHPQIIRLREKMDEIVSKIAQEREESRPGQPAEVSATELKGLKANNVSVQDWAKPACRPIRPDKRKNILLSAVLGLVAGLAIAFFKESLDHTIKNPDDVRRLVGWHFLGCIPRIFWTRKKTMNLLVHKMPQSAVAENYRAIRTGLLFTSARGLPVKCVLVTSPGEQEGKSMTASNLAIAMAQNQKSVLLVEADMRKPSLHKVFKNDAQKGLSSYLSQQLEFDEVVNETKIANLSVVLSGPRPPNPSELLASERMTKFIETAKNRFDYIFLDTPPLMVVTDALIVSKIADGTVLVLESGKPLRKLISIIDYDLKNAGSRLLGFVINKFKVQSREFSHYYKNYYR